MCLFCVSSNRHGGLIWHAVSCGCHNFFLSHGACLLPMQAVVKDTSQELLPTCGSPKQPLLPASSSSSSSGGSVWEALLHIVGAINYGGRVTDPDDRRLLGGIMQAHLSADVLSGSIRLGRPGECVRVYHACADSLRHPTATDQPD